MKLLRIADDKLNTPDKFTNYRANIVNANITAAFTVQETAERRLTSYRPRGQIHFGNESLNSGKWNIGCQEYISLLFEDDTVKIWHIGRENVAGINEFIADIKEFIANGCDFETESEKEDRFFLDDIMPTL